MISANLLLTLALISSAIEVGASDPAHARNDARIIGLTEKINAKLTPSVFKSLDESETIEFREESKVNVTKNGTTFSAIYHEADGSVTFKRSADGKAERFLKADGVLIREKNRHLYFNEFALATRKEFHRRIDEQLKSGRNLSMSPGLTPH